MARDEFKSKNGTLSINQQTISQREKTSQRFGGKGVGSENDRVLFPNSPIGYVDGTNLDRSNVYEAFAKVIDNPSDTNRGFGFSRTEYAYMDYNHPDNPFKEGNVVNYDALTLGTPMEDVKAYKGFPDLVAGDVSNPSLNQTDTPSGLDQDPDGSTYGHTTEEYRRDTDELASLLGRHIDGTSQGNGDIDNLGKYFTKNYVEGEQ